MHTTHTVLFVCLASNLLVFIFSTSAIKLPLSGQQENTEKHCGYYQ